MTKDQQRRLIEFIDQQTRDTLSGLPLHTAIGQALADRAIKTAIELIEIIRSEPVIEIYNIHADLKQLVVGNPPSTVFYRTGETIINRPVLPEFKIINKATDADHGAVQTYFKQVEKWRESIHDYLERFTAEVYLISESEAETRG